MKKGIPAGSQLLLSLVILSVSASAQDAIPPTQAAAQTPAVAAPSPVAVQKRNDTNKDLFPSLNLYLPEGEVDLRARKLVRNVLFESQIQYKFVEGDISTYLRYKYYARDFTYKLGVFDTIEFDPVESGSRDFTRVRGGLLLFEFPANYNQRYFFLTQLDGLSYSETTRPDNERNNLYFKLAYQQGTPFDARLNSIAGESRGRVSPVLTAFRDLGPQKLGFAAAITQGIDQIGGDYMYTKFEAEGLKRSDISENVFLINRLHLGSMVQKQRVACASDVEDCTGLEEPRPYSESFSLPRYEMFRIGGREALKGIDDQPRGTDEAHISNELFFPIFRNRNYKFLGARWSNMYGIGYAGVGSCKCDSGRLTDLSEEVLSDMSDIVADAGLGFETSLTVRNYDIYLSLLFAKTVAAPANLEGQEVRFSVRTSR